MSDNENPEQLDESTIIALRRTKLAAMREHGIPFPNDFRRNVMAGELHAEYGEKDNATLEATPVRVRVAGRMMGMRVMVSSSNGISATSSGQRVCCSRPRLASCL
jgi:lysyl-tRNA synthetase class 2